MGSHPVAVQKQEAFACFLAADPTAIDIPMNEKTIAAAGGKDRPTLNKAFLAGITAHVAKPSKLYVVGEGWEGEHHGGPLLGQLAGGRASGSLLGVDGMVSEVMHGLCGGGREFKGGYSVDVYYVGYLLGMRHGSTEVRKFAARALSACLALDFLLTVPKTGEVIEIGGRATGGVNLYAGIIQALWKGEDPKVPKGDAGIACQMFAELTAEERAMLPPFPEWVGEAVEILRGSEVVCPARFEWWGVGGGWRAQVNRERGWFIQKRTGEQALIVTAIKSGGAHGHPDSFRDWEVAVVADWHITLTEEGLQVHRRPGGEGEPSLHPPPAPRPARPPMIPRWLARKWLSGDAPAWAVEHLPEILWQAQMMERGEVEAEGMLVKAVERRKEGRKDD
jgi:hypothetical protein